MLPPFFPAVIWAAVVLKDWQFALVCVGTFWIGVALDRWRGRWRGRAR